MLTIIQRTRHPAIIKKQGDSKENWKVNENYFKLLLVTHTTSK